ncbi:hypothetical protein EPA93_31425 [Ktedonosporobacter rubrisoli]|uniref:PH domain-containing protein n=1 Tax=Ktedonosporobacter rubrisoli TaxID=2509675 RepID=A0A4P6JWZ0_KTERU|nr:hypothetical protein [Ktedonosporobacter rubrisoli]QBD80247.1 hypothetical protein EPA93_31425 [Ktedonosporobacter rubrisoli]
MASSSIAYDQEFIGPGLSPFKRYTTIFGVVASVAVVLWIAIHQGVSAVGSTIAALLFIGGFVYYLFIIAPVPFTITLGKEALLKRSRRGEVIEVRWEDLTKVREEFFPNGKRIGVVAYRKVTQPGQKAKAWAVYRDDVTDIDALAEALKLTIPATCTWESETVHE